MGPRQGSPYRRGAPSDAALLVGGGMSRLTPAPTKRVHDPSGVATHGIALWSAGESKFRSARNQSFIVMASHTTVYVWAQPLPASFSGGWWSGPRRWEAHTIGGGRSSWPLAAVITSGHAATPFSVIGGAMNRAVKAAVAALMLAVSFAGSVAAGPLEDGVVDAFLSNCVLNVPNLEKIRAASRVFGWKRLSPDEMTMLGPLASGVEAEGWMATQNSLRFIVAISNGGIGSQRAASCSVAHPDVKQSALLDGLQRKVALKPLNDEREAGQRYRAWTTEYNGYSVLIMLTTMADENVAGGSISAAVKLR